VRPAGDVTLRNADGEAVVPIEHGGLYAAGVSRFCAAMANEGSPAASGDDGIRSLQGAIAIAQACRTGGMVPIAAPASPAW
jgi:1,5-anhydro-D-fructose reductase (1,5-anhydro-D-mannitol-forming)